MRLQDRDVRAEFVARFLHAGPRGIVVGVIAQAAEIGNHSEVRVIAIAVRDGRTSREREHAADPRASRTHRIRIRKKETKPHAGA
jgi:hypothetical protein